VWSEYLGSAQHSEILVECVVPWLSTLNDHAWTPYSEASHALLEVIAGMTLVRSSHEYPSLGQYVVSVPASASSNVRFFCILLTFLPFLYFLPLSYLPNSPFRTCWKYHRLGRTAIMGACYQPLPSFQFPFGHPLLHPGSDL